MREIWRWIVGPDVGDEELNRRVQAASLTAVFAIIAIPVVIGLEILAGSSPFLDPLSWFTIPTTFLIPVIALVLLRLRRLQVGIYWLLSASSVILTASAIAYGLSAANFVMLAGMITLAALLAGTVGITLGVIAGLVATAGAYLIHQAQPGTDLYALQNQALMQFALFPLLGLLTWLFSRSLLGLTRRARQQAQELAALNVTLEQRVTELARTSQELRETIARSEHRAHRLALAAETSRAISAAAIDPADLMDRLVQLIREQLHATYVGLFLVGTAGESPSSARLRAGASATGQHPPEPGYEVDLQGTSALAWCLTTRQGLLVTPPDTEAHWLAETRAELILPLLSWGEIMGALTIQSTEEGAFDEGDVTIFQSVADQVANAIVNSRLLQQARTALAEVTQAQRQYQREAWTKYLPQKRITGYQYQERDLRPLGHRLLPEVRQTVQAARTLTTASDGKPTLVAPLTLRGQVIGALGLQDSRRRAWTAEEIAMAEAIAEQVALAVENARLFEEAQASLAEVTATYRRYVREAWSDYLPLQPATWYEYAATENLPPVDTERLRGVTRRAETRSPAATTLAVPVSLRDQVMGVLGFQDAPDRQWTADELAIIETVAEELALALENARLFDEAQARLAEVEAMHRRYLREAWATYLPTRQACAIQATAPGVPALDNLQLPEIQQALAQRRGAVVSRRDDSSVLATPIALRGEVLGAVGLQADGARQWTSEDIAVVESVATELGQAIESARLFAEAQRRAAEQEGLARIAALASSTLEFEELLRRLMQEAARLVGARGCVILLADEDSRTLRTHHVSLGAEIMPAVQWQIPMDTPGFERSIYARGGVYYSNQARTDPNIIPVYRPYMEALDVENFCGVALRVRDRSIGEIYVLNRPGGFGPDELRLLRAIAGYTSNAIENARSYEKLQETAEKLQEMDRLKTQFLANMSHELRTPLNAIIGFSRVILKGIDGPLTENQKVDLNAIYENGQQLLALINNVLDISKIQAGKMELTFAYVDLQPVIRSVMSTAVALVKDKPIELHEEVQPNLPRVWGDEMRLRQVLVNLISNAAKFTERGSITLRAWADAEQVTVSVTDTGIGIAPEHQALIFEEFRQVDASLTRQAGGSGLGLAICRHLVEEQGGRIWVESALGEGSTFSFTIPLRPHSLPPGLAGVELDPTRPIILAVDGQAGVIALYKRYLEKHGYQVVGLQEGAKAVEWARTLRPQAIIQDLTLPDQDGWMVLEALKSAAETRQVPVIISTMNRDARNQALRRGAAAYLIKPVLEDDLLEALKSFAKS